MADYFIAKWNVENGSSIASGEYLTAFTKNGSTLTDLVLVTHANLNDRTKATQQIAQGVNSIEKKAICITFMGPEGNYISTDGTSHGKIVKLSDDEINVYEREILAALGRKTQLLDDPW